MIRDDLQTWLRWMPGWLLLPVTAAILCLLYPVCAARGLLTGLKEGHVEARTGLQIVRAIIEEEKINE